MNSIEQPIVPSGRATRHRWTRTSSGLKGFQSIPCSRSQEAQALRQTIDLTLLRPQKMRTHSPCSLAMREIVGQRAANRRIESALKPRRNVTPGHERVTGIEPALSAWESSGSVGSQAGPLIATGPTRSEAACADLN